MKLKVTAFKESGKYYTEETFDVEGFPKMWSVPDKTTVKDLREMQSKFTYDLWEKIKKGEMLCYCPVSNWDGYYFIFDGVFEDTDSGFLTYLLNRL